MVEVNSSFRGGPSVNVYFPESRANLNWRLRYHGEGAAFDSYREGAYSLEGEH